MADRLVSSAEVDVVGFEALWPTPAHRPPVTLAGRPASWRRRSVCGGGILV